MNRATRMALMSRRETEKRDGSPTQERTYYGDSEARFRDRAGREYHDPESHPAPAEHHTAAAADEWADVTHPDMLTEDMACEWMEHLHNEDGTTGPHWTMDQTTQVMKQKGIDCDPLEFWVAMNAMYSDYFGVAKKMNVNNVDFYAHMAKAFIMDKDSQPNRLARYYEYMAKH